MRDQPREEWPDVLLMLGDQVYADEVSPATLAFIETKRDTAELPGERVLDFEDYTRLYLESWSDPAIRWLLSTVSTAMIFDDHDVHDDWNISEAWLEEMRSHHWWNEHIKAALASYWVYQHLGNLAPEAHEDDELLNRVKAADDAEDLLEEFAFRADRETAGARWSYCRDLGNTRLIVIDSRAGRVLEEGKPLDARRRGVGVGLRARHRRLRPPARGHVAAVAARARDALRRGLERGRGGRRVGPRGRARGRERSARRPTWSTGRRSRSRSRGSRSCSGRSGTGERGEPPASIVALSGDVHHAYLFEVGYPRGTGMKSQRLAGGLLALPQPAGEERAAVDPDRDVARLRARHAHARPARRRARPRHRLAHGRRRPLVRQPGRDAR